MRTLLWQVILTIAGFSQIAAAAGTNLSDSPVNAWVKVEASATGGRHSPIFFYDPTLKNFVLTGGMLGGNYHQAQRHFDTEHLDPGTWTWSNAYPRGLPYHASAGVSDAKAVPADWKEPLWRDADVLRITVNGQGPDSRTHFQWCYDPDESALFACLMNRTLRYDPVARTWSDTGAPTFSKGAFTMVWGSLCYDPVNKEILSVGGSSDEPGGTPGSWVYKIADKKWTRLQAGSQAHHDFRQQCLAIRRRAWALLSAARARFFVTETADEAKASLGTRAKELVESIGKLSRELSESKLAGLESAHAQQAGAALGQTAVAMKTLAAALENPITAETLVALKLAIEPIDWACDDLAAEPTARAGSQMACDPVSRKIVLFGGNELDRVRADTWIYDCPARAWHRVEPKLSPSPRAGHCLVYLPRSGKIALVGGYDLHEDGFRELPDELWTYDVATEEWKLLTAWDLPKQSGGPRTGPIGYVNGNYSGAGSPCIGAATPDDVLVMVDTGGEGRVTWACKVDPAKSDSAGTKARGVADGAKAIASSQGPEAWEKSARPSTAAIDDFYSHLPANQWTALPRLNQPTHRCWNSTAYDPDRRQFLYWGGGHVTYMGTDVAHYSVRSNLWTTSYPPDLPIEPAGGFCVKASRSFRDRPQIPVHAYQAYAYDPPSGLMLFIDRAYNVAEREWEPQTFPVPHGGVMHTLLETTPAGVVLWSEAGLFRFDAASRAWKKLSYQGPDLGQPWCDGGALCFDSKRNCLWMSTERTVFRYDLATGRCEQAVAKSPAALEERALWREQVYVPDADLILMMDLFRSPDGGFKNVAFDPSSLKWLWIDLPFVLDGTMKKFEADMSPWDSSLHYDPASRSVLLHWGDHAGNRVLALRIDRATVKTAEIAGQ